MYKQIIYVITTLFICVFAMNAQAQVSSSEIVYYHNDTLGSPRAATDQNGNLLWRENYAPYGKKLENENAELGNHIGYTGKPHERLTGFTYLNARYYDPLIGRFMAVDPVGYIEMGEQYFQRYTYTDNNPYKYTDPSGAALANVIGLGVSLGLTALDQALRDDWDLEELGVSAVIGLTGVGVLNHVQKLNVLGPASYYSLEVRVGLTSAAAVKALSEDKPEFDFRDLSEEMIGFNVSKGVSDYVSSILGKKKSYNLIDESVIEVSGEIGEGVAKESFGSDGERISSYRDTGHSCEPSNSP